MSSMLYHISLSPKSVCHDKKIPMNWRDVFSTLGAEVPAAINHGPVITVEEMTPYMVGVPGLSAKNLFLKEKKSGDYFLLSARSTLPIELNKIAKTLGFKAFRFASEEELVNYLGVKAGCVTPLAVINDVSRKVKVMFDAGFQTSEHIVVHGVEPDFNASSFSLRLEDVLSFMKHVEHVPEWVNLE